MSAPIYDQMADQTILSWVQDALIEARNGGAFMTTSQFTLDQLINAVDQGQKDFLRDTGVVYWHSGYRGDTNTGLTTVPGEELFPLPQDCQDVRRMGWIELSGVPYGSGRYGQGAYSATIADVVDMPAQDSLVSDGINPPWESQTGTPSTQEETLPAIPATYLNVPPDNVGQVDLLYVPVPTALSNTGVPLSVPPDFAVAIFYRALEILFGSEGEGNDTARARFCGNQYPGAFLRQPVPAFGATLEGFGLDARALKGGGLMAQEYQNGNATAADFRVLSGERAGNSRGLGARQNPVRVPTPRGADNATLFGRPPARGPRRSKSRY